MKVIGFPTLVLFVVFLNGCATSGSERNRASRADDMWAQALYYSSTFTNTHSYANPEELFAKAVELSPPEKRAAIYVSWGDLYAGPYGLRHIYENFMTALTNDLTGKLEDKVKGRDLSDEQQVDQLARTIANGYQATLKDLVRENSQIMVDGFQHSRDRSVKLYLTALAVSTNQVTAWGRLAITAGDETKSLRELAIKKLKRLDPDNAGPYYLDAWSRFDTNNLIPALEAIEAGNQKPKLSCWKGAVPEDVKWVPAEVGEVLTNDAEGVSFMKEFLKILMESNETMIFSKIQLRNHTMLRQMVDKAGWLEKQGRPDLAKRCLRALAMQSLKIIGNDDLDLSWALMGANDFVRVERKAVEMPAGFFSRGERDWFRNGEGLVRQLRAGFDKISSKTGIKNPSNSSEGRVAFLQMKERREREVQMMTQLRQSHEFLKLTASE